MNSRFWYFKCILYGAIDQSSVGGRSEENKCPHAKTWEIAAHEVHSKDWRTQRLVSVFRICWKQFPRSLIECLLPSWMLTITEECEVKFEALYFRIVLQKCRQFQNLFLSPNVSNYKYSRDGYLWCDQLDAVSLRVFWVRQFTQRRFNVGQHCKICTVNSSSIDHPSLNSPTKLARATKHVYLNPRCTWIFSWLIMFPKA